MKKLVLSMLAALAVASSSYSQSERQGGVARFGPVLGTEYGFGAMGMVGGGPVKFEFGGGFSPVLFLLYINNIYGSDDSYFKVYPSGMLGAKLNIAVSNPNKKFVAGLKFGASYNTIMKLGIGGGGSFLLSSNRKFYSLSIGVMVFPKAMDELLDRLNEDEGTSYTEEQVNQTFGTVQMFLSFALLFGK